MPGGVTITGRVATGRGNARGFTGIPWVREQLIGRLGIDPFPGTLNLVVPPGAAGRWAEASREPGVRLDPPDATWCGARCYPARLSDHLPVAIVVPEVPGYPAAQIEVVAAVPLREALSLSDGDEVTLATSGPVVVSTVIFDVDGTLVDTVIPLRIVAERAAAPHGIAITEAVVREALNTNHSFWDLVLDPDRPDRRELSQALSRRAMDLWPSVVAEHARVFPDVAALVAALRARGARLGIVTGGHGPSLAPLRDEGLLDHFEVVITAAHVARRKPDPDGLLKCLAALGVAPGDAVYVGDTPPDVEAARAAGMAAIALLAGAGDSARLSACGPDRIVASHARLLDILEIR